jgi:hypothetical protein
MLVFLVLLPLALFGVYCVSHLWNRFVVKSAEPQTVTMSDGRRIVAVPADLGLCFVYREIFALDVYGRQDEVLGLGGPMAAAPPFLVVDCGANVGLFGLYILEKFPHAMVCAAEPVPDLCAIAQRNLSRFTQSGRAVVFNVGVGRRWDEANVPLEFIPNLSCGSGLPSHLDAATSIGKHVDLFLMLRAVLNDSISSGLITGPVGWFLRRVFTPMMSVPYVRCAASLLFAPLLLSVFAWFRGMNVPKRLVRCRMVSLPRLIELYRDGSGAPTGDLRVGLLKIDVEGAELDALEGADDEFWARVDRVIVETQDVDGRVGTIRRLLASKGFDRLIAVDEDLEVQRLLRITTFFGSRSSLQRSKSD